MSAEDAAPIFDGAKVTFASATRWRFSSSLSVTITPSHPQELKKITQQLTALPLIFIVEPALKYFISS